jgi:zona occludens toxin
LITLITGTPGAGKTLYMVAEELPKYKDRPLFVDGIPDLLVDHLEPLGKVEDWHLWLPENSVLVVDEAQRIWRPRGTGSKVPDGVAAMETHRHRGADILIITQHPNLLDPNIRRLVGRHLHVRRMFGWKRAIVYEWDAATDPGRVTTAIKRSWAYPKKAFANYKSASQHTARGNRIPVVLVVAVLALVALPLVGWKFYDQTIGKWTGDPAELTVDAVATEPATARSGERQELPEILSKVPENIRDASMPVDEHNHLSAPLYAAVAPPVVAPEIVGCIASRRVCTCYTQQQTPVWVPEPQCRERAAGLYYDPYRSPPLVVEGQNYNPPPVDGTAPPRLEGV